MHIKYCIISCITIYIINTHILLIFHCNYVQYTSTIYCALVCLFVCWYMIDSAETQLRSFWRSISARPQRWTWSAGRRKPNGAVFEVFKTYDLWDLWDLIVSDLFWSDLVFLAITLTFGLCKWTPRFDLNTNGGFCLVKSAATRDVKLRTQDLGTPLLGF